ncbi:MAG: hypothetical protein AAGF12_36745 [Myxococcota bacterium]
MLRVALFAALLAVGCGDDDPIGTDAGDSSVVPDAAREDGATTPLPAPPPVEPGRHDVEILDTRQVVPGPGLGDAPIQAANNNLDVVRFQDEVYLAIRTAPDHFASALTETLVFRSADEESWVLDATFAMGTDLREPRFLVIDDTLFLYISILGTNPNSFEPGEVAVTEKPVGGTWSTLEVLPQLDGHVAWRARTEGAVHYLSAYEGGETIYLDPEGEVVVRLFTTTDGRTFAPLDPLVPDLNRGGSSETDFAIGDDGMLYGVMRNEGGEEGFGLGSKVCRAAPDSLASWTCVADARKFDSPLMFWHDGEAYLVGRRNVTETGAFDIQTEGELRVQSVVANLEYVRERKRCSLWRYVQGEDRFAYLLDLPSRGDTCFPGYLRSSDDEIVIYNYSSPIDGEDLSWVRGQNGETRIYRHVLRFTPR